MSDLRQQIGKLLLAVSIAASLVVSQSFRLSPARTSLSTQRIDDSTSVSAADSLVDSLVPPESLKLTDPLRYKYFAALKDSLSRDRLRTDLKSKGDTVQLELFDSLFVNDSTIEAKEKFDKWYRSLSKFERKKYDGEKKAAIQMARMDSILNYKDSIQQVKDSIRQNTPRILETYALADSLLYKRLVMWTHDRKFHNLTIVPQDTTYNNHFYDYPFYKEDVNVSYAGVIGSGIQSYNFFKRKEEENMAFYSPYLIYTYTPENLPMYNTKTPYTELAYSGSTFAMNEKEESNVRVITTQNIFPSLNLTLGYQRYGGKGILQHEDNDNRSTIIATNYLGKKYLMHAGYLYNKIGRSENGGTIDDSGMGFNWVLDTLVDGKEIPVRLSKASTLIKKNTVFLDQSYRIPFSFLHKLSKKKALQDSTLSEETKADSLDRNVITAFIGHSSEFTTIRKIYNDEIGLDDFEARALYNDQFYINPTKTYDSLRVMRLENKVFIRLQPWKEDGVVSKLDVGIGDKLMNYFSFSPQAYTKGGTNVNENSAYLYGGVRGRYKQYFVWDADGQYTFLGSETNDFKINGNMEFNAYPFRSHKHSPLKLNLHFSTSLKEPDYYERHMYSNHYVWDNDFNKISRTDLQARLSIPHWRLAFEAGYSLLSNNIYYDENSIVRQNGTAMSVLSGCLTKDFTLWKLHFDNSILGQISSNQDVLPLPGFAAKLKYYLQFDVVKKVMQMQIGANIWVNSKWYSPGWNPALGVFYNQKEHLYGTTPYIDAFINIQWKRACVFIKLCNANMGWPSAYNDYFSAHHYIRPQRVLKFGITWPFYIQNETIHKEKDDKR